MLPVAVFWGSTKIVYVPVVGSVFVSMKPPFVPTNVGDTSALPSGFRIETFVLQQVDDPMVTSVIRRLIRVPPLPANVAVAFSSGAVVVTVSGGPPAEIVYDEPNASAGLAAAARKAPITRRTTETRLVGRPARRLLALRSLFNCPLPP
jgi:hypothetical protein